jgi:hypothetical protein
MFTPVILYTLPTVGLPIPNTKYYDMIYYDTWYIYLTAVGLTPGGSSTAHIYTQTVFYTQYRERKIGKCWPCPIFANYTLEFALQLRKKHGKTSVEVALITVYSAFEKSLCNYKMYWKWFPRTIVSKNWIKQLQTLTALFYNWIKWNNSTVQRQLRYWQPNLRTVA